MHIGYWCIRNPWQSCVAIDEFGPGTLDGDPAHGSSYDACGAAVIENVAANYEGRLPNYANIGHIRVDMITNGQWTQGAVVGNPRTSGCVIGNVNWELARRKYRSMAFHDYQDAVLSEADIRTALETHAASIYIVTNASSLPLNEQGVHRHFVAIVGYGGDNADGSTNKVYVLNSDVAGQHGTGLGQWMTLAQFLAAQPHGFTVMAPPVAPPPPPPAPDIPGTVIDLNQIQQLVQKYVADALAKLRQGG